MERVYSSNLQSIPGRPAALNAQFARLNGLLSKKPLRADWGEGCDDSMTVCSDSSMSAFFRRAWSPQSMNTTGLSLSFTTRITSSVNASHPFFWCDAATRSRTVKVVLSSSTPLLAHASRFP